MRERLNAANRQSPIVLKYSTRIVCFTARPSLVTELGASWASNILMADVKCHMAAMMVALLLKLLQMSRSQSQIVRTAAAFIQKRRIKMLEHLCSLHVFRSN